MISAVWEVAAKLTLKMGVKNPTQLDIELLFTRKIF